MSQSLFTNAAAYSVSEIAQAIKHSLEQEFGQVQVRGELAGVKVHSSGHIYYRLKDQDAVLEAVTWRGVAGRLGIKPEDGLDVIARGRITSFPGRSQYQLIVDKLELAGQGAILAMLAARKAKLLAEGLFDSARKRPLPPFPKVIGVITSPTGAVIQDILHRLADRYPCHVIIWPVAVQGDLAAAQIVEALTEFPLLPSPLPRPDLIIVARGGGSLEDLLPFSDEGVVRAAVACPIPVIAAIGHETDVSLLDLAADVRAPTPTAAAEIATPHLPTIAIQINSDGQRLNTALQRQLQQAGRFLQLATRQLFKPAERLLLRQQRLDTAAERAGQAWQNHRQRANQRLRILFARLLHPAARLQLLQQRLQYANQRLNQTWPRLLLQYQQRLMNLQRILHSNRYDHTLQRGFALIRQDHRLIATATELKTEKEFTIQFADALVAILPKN